ncbi:MAG: AGE family epimerase/isomerase [Rhizobiales bacterium]|nr:AGE family epimerase/isomerase [Hyphomicrobiales bacterium]
MTELTPVPATKWVTLPYHRRWLAEQAEDLFFFFDTSLDPEGGFFLLDEAGDPLPDPAREIHTTTRMVHCYAIARLMGRPGADRFIDHGMDFLWNDHRDTVHGGYVWGVGGDERKQAYGHAFTLLAASSAKLVGHPDADRLLDDVTEVIATRFFEARHGASAEEFGRDWSPISNYRGQNSNMHLTEATMAAFEATGERLYLDWAESIATHIIRRSAPDAGWMVPEHFDEDWNLVREFSDGDVFRPYGLTPGHSLEWTRLLLQLWELGGRRVDWLPEAARALFAKATSAGWDAERGGFLYTLGWDGAPHHRNRLWWPAAEGVGAAAFLNAIDGTPDYEAWYRRIWDFIAAELIDADFGGWRTEPAGDPKPLFSGKPDIYHALQACLIPLLPTTGSITRGLVASGLKDI